MSVTQTIDPINITASLCNYNMNINEQQKSKLEVKPLLKIRIIKKIIQTNKVLSSAKYEKRNAINKSISQKFKYRTVKSTNNSSLKYPEMRGGVLYNRCCCIHRDGLQDTCPLTECQDQLKCSVKPWPSCLPAKYLSSRFPAQYPPND